MEALGKWLFPDHPRMVRYRKLRIVFFAIVLGALSCALIGVLLVVINRPWHG